MSPVIEIDYKPYDYQAGLHNSGTRFNLVVGGRRVGKSKMALQECIRHCLQRPGAVCWWISPTYSLSREIGWEEFLEYREAYDLAISKVHDTLQRVRFKNGSVLYFKGADNEKALRGRGLTFLVIDEAAYVSEEVWTRALRPALSDKDGSALLISTPNGRNWFYDLFCHAQEAPNWTAYHWPTPLNPLISSEELKEAASSISATDFRQEYLAEFITRAGLVYDEFTQANIIPPGSPFPHDYKIYLGIDFGFASPSAVAFLAVGEGQVVMFDELYLARTPMADLEKAITHKLAEHHLSPVNVSAVYTDPSGNAEELSSGISPVDFLRLSHHGWEVKNMASRIAPGVALLRSYILNANGERRFLITNNCREAIRSLSGYTYEKKDGSQVVKEEPLKDGIHDHMCDAIRYFFVNKFDHAKFVARTIETNDYVDVEVHGRLHMKHCPQCHRQFPSSTLRDLPPYYCKECTANG